MLAGNDLLAVADDGAANLVVLRGMPSAVVQGPTLARPPWAIANRLWNGIDDRRFALNVHNGLIIWDLATDCDSDGVSDPDEIAAGSPDVNGNAVPDACECLGDLDSNGLVDAVDLAIVLAAWGDVGKPYPQADADGSGSVDAIDLAVVLNEWGPCP